MAALEAKTRQTLFFAWIYPMDFAKMPQNAVAA
jgi:hypothetical protein